MGPFETSAEAAVAAGAQGHAVASAVANRSLLWRELEAAGVEMGAYDQRILDWLSKWEPGTVAVIAGWVNRAARRNA